jgi:hypothetical protein
MAEQTAFALDQFEMLDRLTVKNELFLLTPKIWNPL